MTAIMVASELNNNLLVVVAASAIYYGTPLFFAGLGEVLTERSGVLNLGVEGMMLLGAVAASVTSARAPGPAWLVLILALLAAMFAAACGAAVHAFAVITLRVNQTVSGLALTILAMTVGLIRSEAARDLRTLTATGATSFTRRSLDLGYADLGGRPVQRHVAYRG